MKLLYVSKALVVAAYRDKIRELARSVSVTAVIPDRWGRTPIEPSPPDVPEPRRVRVRLAGHNHLHCYPGARQWLDRVGPDLVHIDEEPYSLVTLQLALHCSRRGTPFVFFAWQNLTRRLPPPFARIRSIVFRHAAGGIAGTDSAAAVLREAGYRGRLSVVPQFGVDPERYRPDRAVRETARRELAVSESAFVIGYGGRLVREKGVHLLLDAFARLPRADPVPILLRRSRPIRRPHRVGENAGSADGAGCARAADDRNPNLDRAVRSDPDRGNGVRRSRGRLAQRRDPERRRRRGRPVPDRRCGRTVRDTRSTQTASRTAPRTGRGRP
jgi:AraC-like DNA-binding protein